MWNAGCEALDKRSIITLPDLLELMLPSGNVWVHEKIFCAEMLWTIVVENGLGKNAWTNADLGSRIVWEECWHGCTCSFCLWHKWHLKCQWHRHTRKMQITSAHLKCVEANGASKGGAMAIKVFATMTAKLMQKSHDCGNRLKTREKQPLWQKMS